LNILIDLLAQATSPTAAAPAAPTTQPAPPFLVFLRDFGPIILIVVIFYFFIFGSKRKQEKQRRAMLSELKKGDRVQTIGGIIGTVVEARDNEVLVKVDESSNTKIRFSRSAIHRVVEEEKAESK
jgi:preprotein translocase subunit YajC